MAATNQETTAVLTEHFRYTPLTLLDDIINTVNELVFRAINAIESGFGHSSPESLGFRLPTDTYPSDEARTDALFSLKQTEIDTGIIQLESLLNAIVDKDFDKFEIYTLRNILAIGHEEEGDLARWVRLEHYKNLEVESNKNLVTPEELQMQRRKVQETAKLNAMLKAEEARNQAILLQLKGLLGKGSEEAAGAHFGFLTSSQHTSPTSQPLSQNLRYALSQLPALRELLDQLKTSLASIPSARHTESDEDAKRRAYIDSQSRRALQRRGIEAGDAGQAAAGAGRRVGQEEIAGLEAVAQALGQGEKMEE